MPSDVWIVIYRLSICPGERSTAIDQTATRRMNVPRMIWGGRSPSESPDYITVKIYTTATIQASISGRWSCRPGP